MWLSLHTAALLEKGDLGTCDVLVQTLFGSLFRTQQVKLSPQ